jgi:hypothetical protein
MKTRPDSLSTAENEYVEAKHENWTRRHSYRQKWVRGAQNMKTGPDALKTAKNGSGSAKHEN